MNSVKPGVARQAHIARLLALRRTVAVDPFPNLNQNMSTEPLYYERSTEEKRQFWLNRYNKNVMAWYWEGCGVTDIRATFEEEPMKTYSREQFAFVCDAMWNKIISRNVEKLHLAQSAQVSVRALDAHLTTPNDQTNYRAFIGNFNERFNLTHHRDQYDLCCAAVSYRSVHVDEPLLYVKTVCTEPLVWDVQQPCSQKTFAVIPWKICTGVSHGRADVSGRALRKCCLLAPSSCRC